VNVGAGRWTHLIEEIGGNVETGNRRAVKIGYSFICLFPSLPIIPIPPTIPSLMATFPFTIFCTQFKFLCNIESINY